MLPPPLADGGVGGGGADGVVGVTILLAGDVGAAGAGCGVALLSTRGVGAAGAAGAVRRSLLVAGVVGVTDGVAAVTLLSLLASDAGAADVALLSVRGVDAAGAAGAARGVLLVVGVAGVGGVADVAGVALLSLLTSGVGGVTAGGVGVTGCGVPLPLLIAGAGGVGVALLAGGVTVTGGMGSHGVWPLTMMPLPLKILIRSSSSEPVLTRSTVSANACEYGTLLLLITPAVLGSTSIGASLLAGIQEDNTKISTVKKPAVETCRSNCSEIIRFSL
jgi:hypothetical protein